MMRHQELGLAALFYEFSLRGIFRPIICSGGIGRLVERASSI